MNGINIELFGEKMTIIPYTLQESKQEVSNAVSLVKQSASSTLPHPYNIPPPFTILFYGAQIYLKHFATILQRKTTFTDRMLPAFQK